MPDQLQVVRRQLNQAQSDSEAQNIIRNAKK